MLRWILASALCLSACAPAPVSMHPSDAAEMLARFAVGSGPADVCTPSGRATLRGAVRAYGAAMAEGGQAWPTVPALGQEPNHLDQVEAAVLIAFSAGFVERSDFIGDARARLTELTFGHWSFLQKMRSAAEVACAEVVELQQAAGRFVLESERYRDMSGGARGARDVERLRRQHVRMQRAQTAMNDLAAQLEARLAQT